MLEPNELYLTGLKVKWDKIERFSYLRKIAALNAHTFYNMCGRITTKQVCKGFYGVSSAIH